ncbi:MAG: tRNA (adenosine(37)-N6)-threonylcarbamoyltransferase complex dimerization subunit type 1 TsaB [Rhizonema sp. PD37]|nr:tRNA (adenosine(37)-N6)-threonylcarbamoyltransferase complex dimerization subunit type 1 TsaB [Rhizonema sp. PD37]
MELDVKNEPEDTEQIKYGLALHTTTPELGLAMSRLTGDTRCGVWNLERNLSSQIHQYLVEFIHPQTWADLAFISVAKGPGGFTGSRIGVVTARTLGQQLNIPVFAISTLAAVAWDHLPSKSVVPYGKPFGFTVAYTGKPASSTASPFRVYAVEMPAQRGQVFAAIYQPLPNASGLNVLLPDSVFTQEAWQEKLANWKTSYQLIEAKSGLAATVTSVLDLAYLEWQQGKRPDWSEALPFYGQHPVE